MASVASQLRQEVTAYSQSDSLEDVREICADGTYFPNNLHNYQHFKESQLYFSQFSLNSYNSVNQSNSMMDIFIMAVCITLKLQLNSVHYTQLTSSF